MPAFGQSTLWKSGATSQGMAPPSSAPPNRVNRMLLGVSKPEIWSTPSSPA